MIAVVVLLLVLLMIAAFALTVRNMRDVRELASPDDLTPESRTLYRRIQRLYTELRETAERNKDFASPFVAQEALAEGERLLQQSREALLLRDRLKREVRSQYGSEKQVSELQARLMQATSIEERGTLESALRARESELEQYGGIQNSIDQIDSALHQAEALLGEMKARVASSATGSTAEGGVEGLREAISRMRALNESVDEIEEITSNTGNFQP